MTAPDAATQAQWAAEITRRADAHWTEARRSDLARGKTLAVTPWDAAPLLRALGLTNADATLPPDRARKFFQVNHMIAVLGPSLRELMAERASGLAPLRIVDAACGRSYLTLALAWWLRHRMGRDAEVLGIDRNPDLVAECARRAAMIGLEGTARFQVGTLGEVTAAEASASASIDRERGAPRPGGKVDVTISLHACDTATDEALALGVEMGSTLIAAAPCCQAELARAWSELPGGHAFSPLHRIPHLRREAAATLTDTLRTLLLRAVGYEVWPLEFVPSEHTPKNTLLRAMDRGQPDPAAWAEYLALRDAAGGVGIRLEHALAAIDYAPPTARPGAPRRRTIDRPSDRLAPRVIRDGPRVVLARVAHGPHHRDRPSHGHFGLAYAACTQLRSELRLSTWAWDAGSRTSGGRLSSTPANVESDSDADLVVAIASGERPALAALYDRYASTLLGLGIRVLRSRRDAEDVVHDVFLEVWRRAHGYDPARASVRGWLLLMMRCRSLDRRKSAAFSLSTPLDTVGHDDAVHGALSRAAARLSDGGGDAGAAVDHERAVAALAALPIVQREVLLLGYFEGLTSSEIATELGIPLGTVKSRVAGALRGLRAHMGIDDERFDASAGGTP